MIIYGDAYLFCRLIKLSKVDSLRHTEERWKLQQSFYCNFQCQIDLFSRVNIGQKDEKRYGIKIRGFLLITRINYVILLFSSFWFRTVRCFTSLCRGLHKLWVKNMVGNIINIFIKHLKRLRYAAKLFDG